MLKTVKIQTMNVLPSFKTKNSNLNSSTTLATFFEPYSRCSGFQKIPTQLEDLPSLDNFFDKVETKNFGKEDVASSLNNDLTAKDPD